MFLEGFDKEHVGCASTLSKGLKLGLIINDILSELLNSRAHSTDAACIVKASWALNGWYNIIYWFGFLEFYIIFSLGFCLWILTSHISCSCSVLHDQEDDKCK